MNNENIKNGNEKGIGGVQAGLWRIKKEWIIRVSN